MLPPPPPGMFPSAAEGGPPFNLPLFFAAQAAQQGATEATEVRCPVLLSQHAVCCYQVPHPDYSTGTAEQILLLNQYIQQAAGVLAEDNNMPAEASGAQGSAVPPESRGDPPSSEEAVVPPADPSSPPSTTSPRDTANDVVQAMLAASGMLDAANAAAAAAGVDPANGQELDSSMAHTDSNGGDGDSGRPYKMQRVTQ